MEGIDIIINGHSHELMKEPLIINDTVLHMSGCYGEHLGVLEFDYDVKLSNFRGENINIEKEEMDKVILQTLEENKKIAIDNLSTALYSINRDMWHDVVEENPITNLLADAIKDVLKTDLAIINSGIVNSGIKKGKVSLKKLLEICPSPLNPTYMKLKGKYIKAALEKSLDPEVCYLDGKGPGFRGRFLGRLHVSGAIIEHNNKNIKRVRINGEELEEERYYTVATSDYLQRGTGYEDLGHNIDESYRPEYLRITLRDYLSKEDYLNKAYTDRWINID